MKNYITPILASTIIFFVCGCEKEEKPYVPVQLCPEITNNMDTILKYIPGTWSWVEEKRFNRSDMNRKIQTGVIKVKRGSFKFGKKLRYANPNNHPLRGQNTASNRQSLWL
jgi:hypothetical protein